MIWPISDSALDPVRGIELAAPGFEGASPYEVVGEVFGGDAAEASDPLLEAAVVGVDVVDVQMRRFRRRLSGRRDGVKGNPRSPSR